MKRIVLALAAAMALFGGCFLFDGSDPDVLSVKVRAVSFDWTNTVWENVQFTVKNTGNVALASIDLYYHAECLGGTFDDVATFPSIYFDTNSPVEPGDTCFVGAELSTLTGGAQTITVYQMVLEDDWGTSETTDCDVVFTAP